MIHRMNHVGRVLPFLLIPFLVGAPGTSPGATLYRCEIDGRVEFRQTACEAGEESLQHVFNTSSGLTPSEPGRRLKKMSDKSDTVKHKRPYKASDRECWSKRQKLEQVERHLRAGYRASEYERLHQRQRGYAAFLRRFCR